MHKRSISIDGHRTSVSLEDAFWQELTDLAQTRQLSLNALVTEIDQAHGGQKKNLSSALRLYVLEALRRRVNRA